MSFYYGLKFNSFKIAFNKADFPLPTYIFLFKKKEINLLYENKFIVLIKKATSPIIKFNVPVS